MGTNCTPLAADLFLFCYERDFMLSLSDNNQVNVVEAFNFTSRYLDDLVITLMYCSKLHAWWLTQSQLATLISSLIALIARWWVGSQIL